MRVSPQLDFVVLLSQPREGHHVSGLPREESTGMRVPPQLDFRALSASPGGPSRIGLTLRGKHRHVGATAARLRRLAQPARETSLMLRAYLARKAPT